CFILWARADAFLVSPRSSSLDLPGRRWSMYAPMRMSVLSPGGAESPGGRCTSGRWTWGLSGSRTRTQRLPTSWDWCAIRCQLGLGRQADGRVHDGLVLDGGQSAQAGLSASSVVGPLDPGDDRDPQLFSSPPSLAV